VNGADFVNELAGEEGGERKDLIEKIRKTVQSADFNKAKTNMKIFFIDEGKAPLDLRLYLKSPDFLQKAPNVFSEEELRSLLRTRMQKESLELTRGKRLTTRIAGLAEAAKNSALYTYKARKFKFSNRVKYLFNKHVARL
jgi:hypothetical protein